MTQEYSKHT